MKKTPALLPLTLALALSACSPQPAPVAEPPPATEPAAVATPTAADQTADWKLYQNADFGLSFRVPAGWFGPEEYVSDRMLRVEIGSDNVYPYGTDPLERVTQFKDSYYVLIQYSQNDQGAYWQETYQSLVQLQDGESLSDLRSKIIRVRPLELGRFSGFEYISTLSDTAQTEPVYGRQVILVDDQSNVLTILGNPSGVEIASGGDWRQAYQAVDEANLLLFRQILDSITIQ
ncbi:MAG TPA: hypothetical protein VLL49_04205 [Anaerolineales bacterium]|nr:hypothetical protein [Anaerolineales bacterium]